MMWRRSVAPATAGRAGATAALVLLLVGCAGSFQHLGSYGATCTSNQTDGSYKCICDSRLEVDGYSCLDFDECENNPTLCGNGVCVNTPGGYDCVCAAGFTPSTLLDGNSCLDMDECATFDNVCMFGRCENTSGTFKCICDKGHQSESINDFTVFPAFSCKDVDECKSPQSCRNGQCINTLGSHICTCPSNYELVPNGTASKPRSIPVSKVEQFVDTHNITLEWPQPSMRVDWYAVCWRTLEGDFREHYLIPSGPEARTVRATLSDLEPGGRYTFNVTAHFSNITSNLFSIDTRTRPLIQSKLTLMTIYHKTQLSKLVVHYTPTPQSASHFDSYRFRLEDADTALTLSQPANISVRRVEFFELVQGRLYNFTMWTVSGNVTSHPEKRQTRLTPRPIKQLNATVIGPRKITLVWDTPVGDYTNFKVQCKRLPFNDHRQSHYTEELGITVESLLPQTRYSFTVVVYSGRFGDRVWPKSSHELSTVVTTRHAPPPAPRRFRVQAAQPRSVNFSWQLDPADVEDKLCRFLLEYAPQNNPQQNNTLEFRPSARNGSVSGLVPGAWYWFSVRAETSGGKGAAARLVTYIERDAPREVQRSSSTVTVSFRTDCSPAGGVFYTLVLAEEHIDTLPLARLPSWRDVQTLATWPPYQVTEPYYLSSPVEEFTIGSDRCDADGQGYCNGPLKPGSKYYVKLRAYTTHNNFTDSGYTVVYTDANTNYTLIIISSISATALLLLLFIVMRKRCWIKDNQPGTLQLPRNEHRNPFYLNLLFREECSREIAEIEQQHYDEMGEHEYEEIEENHHDEI